MRAVRLRRSLLWCFPLYALLASCPVLKMEALARRNAGSAQGENNGKSEMGYIGGVVTSSKGPGSWRMGDR